MRIHFYKLHLGGNGFVLIDLAEHPDIQPSLFTTITVQICDRRYGVGASACLFLSADNTLRFFLPSGYEYAESFDGLFCAARFAFDSGRIKKGIHGENSIAFKTMNGDRALNIISSREFKLALGSPFSLLSGKVINQNTAGTVETFTIDNKPVCISAFHIRSDIICAHPSVIGSETFFNFYTKIRQNFPGKKVYLVFSRNITREIISIRTIKRGPSTSTASAAAALVSSVLSGGSETDALCIFEKGSPSLEVQQSKLSEDIDNSRKITILWDAPSNELYGVASGAYIFEGHYETRITKGYQQ